MSLISSCRDKHDRPYKCNVLGCEKLPGFTYSGGLLRHEREVHGKHGGPRKHLNCPHSTCKRHTGKGFSRQENLNEHLRRVHTAEGMQDPEVTEEEPELNVAQKRKRGVPQNEEQDIREEMKRIKQENAELRERASQQEAQLKEVSQRLNDVSIFVIPIRC